jgi:hypothetical protein
MGSAKPPEDVKLFIGLISGQPSLFKQASLELMRMFGPVETATLHYPWNHTNYYEKEMGRDLFRQFLFFQNLISPDRMAEIKGRTNLLEQQWVLQADSALPAGKKAARRQINLDPGYLAPSKVVLATTKDFAHRIYLSKGIYAEVALVYRGKSFVALPYTYPDFRTPEYIELFNIARSSWIKSMAFK